MGKREWRQKQFSEILAKNFPKLMKDKSQIQALKKFSRTKIKTTTLNIYDKYIIVKLLKNLGQK